MNQKIFNILDKNRVCGLSTILKNGYPHAAAMHFSYAKKPFEIYIQTERTGKKTEALLRGKPGKSSIVVGLSEDDWVTLQLDGQIKVVDSKKELLKIYKVHYSKNPSAEQYKDLPDTIFLKFIPNWWRYTEFEPKMKVISSEE